MSTERLIRPVIQNKKNHQKMVTIPKKSNLEEGDYVEIVKLPDRK